MPTCSLDACCRFYLSNSDQGELELSKDNVTQTAILGAAWSDYEEDQQGTTLILEYDLAPSKLTWLPFPLVFATSALWSNAANLV